MWTGDLLPNRRRKADMSCLRVFITGQYPGCYMDFVKYAKTVKHTLEKNNLAGLGAYDHSPGSAICFESREECVMFLARLLRERPGESLEEIGMWYASDPRWAEKVAGCIKRIVEAGQDHPC